VVLVVGYERRTEWVTWVEENGTLLLRNGCGVLDHRKACRSNGAIVIVHRNPKGSASQIGIRGVNYEAPTITPSDLQNIQRSDEVEV